MTTLDHAHAGDQVHLVADIQNGEGQVVRFVITTDSGDELATVDAPVADGVARSEWKIDVGGRALPLTLHYFARLAGQEVKSGELVVDPPGVISTPAWLLLAGPSGGAPGELSSLDAGDQLIAQQHAEAAVPFRPLVQGDEVALRVEVGDRDGAPLVGDFGVTYTLEKEQSEGAGDFAPVKEFVRELHAPGGVSAIYARWTVDTMGLAPPYRFRFMVSWQRRPGEAATPEDARGTTASEMA